MASACSLLRCAAVACVMVYSSREVLDFLFCHGKETRFSARIRNTNFSADGHEIPAWTTNPCSTQGSLPTKTLSDSCKEPLLGRSSGKMPKETEIGRAHV